MGAQTHWLFDEQALDIANYLGHRLGSQVAFMQLYSYAVMQLFMQLYSNYAVINFRAAS